MHIKQTFVEIGATHKFIVYGGEREVTLGDDVWMIPLSRLMDKLIAEQQAKHGSHTTHGTFAWLF
ncbi:MAG: hypothetical protein OXD44_03575 [Gammaproteobacteria bacterium]|nr:hypothetical protein [Gammaproteobacteria bacterium]